MRKHIITIVLPMLSILILTDLAYGIKSSKKTEKGKESNTKISVRGASIDSNLTGRKYRFEQKVKKKRSYEELCGDYRDALTDYKFSLPLVRDFRRDLLNEHYTFLLERYGEFWNFIRHAWLTAPVSQKAFIQKYREEHRYTKWYLRGTDRIEQQETYAKLKDKYKEPFRRFVEAHFNAKPFGRFGWAYEIRNGKNGKVFPYGSVVELAEGELMISRHARIKINEKYGGFHIVVKIRNDLNGSLIRVVPHRGNFRAKTPRLTEVVRSARRWTEVYDDEVDIDTKEQKLGLLLDQRYDHCIAAAKERRQKRIAQQKKIRNEVKPDKK